MTNEPAWITEKEGDTVLPRWWKRFFPDPLPRSFLKPQTPPGLYDLSLRTSIPRMAKYKLLTLMLIQAELCIFADSEIGIVHGLLPAGIDAEPAP